MTKRETWLASLLLAAMVWLAPLRVAHAQDAAEKAEPSYDVTVGVEAGVSKGRGLGASAGVALLGRAGLLALGLFGSESSQLYAYRYRTLAAGAGIASRNGAWEARLLAVAGQHAYTGVHDDTNYDNTSSESGDVPFAGLRAGVAYEVFQGPLHLETALWLTLEEDLKRKHLPPRESSVEPRGPTTIGTTNFAAGLGLGGTWDL